MKNLAVLVLAWLCAAQLSAAEVVAGPMPGHSAMRAVKIWLQVDQPAEVRLKFWAEGDPGGARETAVIQASGEHAHAVEFDVAGLKPGTTYEYLVLLGGREQTPEYPQRFVTQPLWQWREEPPAFSFALGSCSFVNQTEYDRPGRPYGGDHQIYDAIADKQPNFMLWMGDNWYYREVDWDSVSGLYARVTHVRKFEPLRRLLTATHHYATWDDHDFGPNNSDRSYRLREEALQVFDAFWPNPDFSAGGTGGVTNNFEWHDAEFFLLDNRYFRDANERTTGDRQVLGEGQIEWLINALKFSRANFKFVVIGGQFLNSAEIFENLDNMAPAERRRILDAIDAEDIPGVVFLSGDRHQSMLLKKDRDTDYPLYEWTVSPLTAGAGRSLDQRAQYVVEGSQFNRRAFGTISISGPRSDRVAELTLHDSDGKPLWSSEIRARDLRP